VRDTHERHIDDTPGATRRSGTSRDIPREIQLRHARGHAREQARRQLSPGRNIVIPRCVVTYT